MKGAGILGVSDLFVFINFVSCMDLDALLESIETEADWPVEAKPLQLIEKSLKCSICHATMRSAVLLSNCGHSFCSYCIRQFLLKEKICPLCRKPATESDIVRNITLNEVLDIFKEQRNDLLELCRTMFSKSHVSTVESASSTSASPSMPIVGSCQTRNLPPTFPSSNVRSAETTFPNPQSK